MNDGFFLTDSEMELIIKFIGHAADTDCDCFDFDELIAGSKIINRFARIMGEPPDQWDKAIEDEIRKNGEP